MPGLLKDKYVVVLVVLLAITLFSWLMSSYVSLVPRFIGALLIFLAFVTVQLIISQYTELNKAVLAVRVVFWLWTIAACASSIEMYLR
jgi:hypothetical protein